MGCCHSALSTATYVATILVLNTLLNPKQKLFWLDGRAKPMPQSFRFLSLKSKAHVFLLPRAFLLPESNVD